MLASRRPLLLAAAALLACNPDAGTTTDSATDGATASTTKTSDDPTDTAATDTAATGTPTTTASASATDTADTTAGSATATMGGTTTTDATTDATTATTGPNTGTTTGETTMGVSGTTTGSTGDGTSTTGVDDTGADTDCGGGDVQFSYIWIANSPEGTVSKIDTETLLEVARYRTGPQGSDPSRTSVNLKGDVAITNRDGSITKIGAIEEHCKETNGQAGIQTSQGKNDVLAYGQDECVLWNTKLMPASRPAAWTSGDKLDPDDPCSPSVGEKVWTSAPQGGDAWVYLLDGETGAILDQTLVPGANGGLGIYGGAVDQNNDFWGVTYSAGPLVHVRYDDMTFETIPLPIGSAYGFTVDAKGRPWVGGWDGNLQRYDPDAKQWTTAKIPAQYAVLSRGMNDVDGDLWIAALFDPQGLMRVNTDTAEFVEHVGGDKLVGIETPTGASVDVQGKVWLVDQSKDGGGAFVYNPMTKEVKWVGGLNGPYTYSDMTGYALKNVAPQ
jgi:hypothetical protein